MQKKFYFLSIAVLLLAYSYAGDTIKVKQSVSSYVGFSFTPGMSYRLLKQNKSAPASTGSFDQDVMDKRKRYEIPQFGFNAGFKVGVRITRFLNFESGLEYSSIQYLDTNNSYHYDGWWHNPSLADLYRIHTRYNYHYINVPVGLKFLIGKKKLQCVISTGLIFTGLIIRNATTYQYQLDKPTIKNTSHEDSYRWASVNLSPYFGIGIDYHINKLLSLCIMPIAQMQCLKNINEPITEYQCMAGLNTSLLFNLSKRK